MLVYDRSVTTVILLNTHIRMEQKRSCPSPLSACDPARLAKVELFCSDMDGTWLGKDHHPTTGGLLAIKEAEQAGLTWVFATGRCVKSAQDASRVALLSRPGIYSNGALVLGTHGKELYALDLPAVVLPKLQELAEEMKLAMLMGDRDRVVALDSQHAMAMYLHDVYNDPRPEGWDRSTPLPNAQMVHMVGPPDVIDQLVPRVLAAVGHIAAVSRNLPTDLSITCVNANKGFACSQLRSHLGISGDVLGIGDSGNDVAMLNAVDISIAMANASPETLAAAAFSTRASNCNGECPGVLEAVRAVVGAKMLQSRL